MRKENWSGYATDVDILIDEVDPTPENYKMFVEAIRVTSRKHDLNIILNIYFHFAFIYYHRFTSFSLKFMYIYFKCCIHVMI